MNDTLLDQCRREAEERYPTTWRKVPFSEDTSAMEKWPIENLLHQNAYAAALYHERSKRPPTVQQIIYAPVDELRDALKGVADWLDGPSMGTWQYMEGPNFYGDKQAHIQNARAVLAKYPLP